MSNRDTETTRHYHEQTKHSYRSVRSDAHSLDFSNRPVPFKTYPGLKPIPLPHQWEETEITALSAVSAVTSPTKEERIPSLSELARLLYYSAGIIKQRKYPGGTLMFRAASCTGALYEVELYVVCGDLPDLPAGIYHFSPKDFALYRLREGDYRAVVAQASGEEPNVVAAPALILSTGTYWRNAWKYRARTYRHFGWDNGTIVAHLLAMGSALQLPTQLVLGFVDKELNQLLDLDTQREVTLSIVSLGTTTQKAAEPSTKVEVLELPTLPPSDREVDYPEMRTLHSATSLPSKKEVVRWRGDAPVRPLPAPEGAVWKLDPDPEGVPDSIEKVIRRRGSSRQFEHKPISFQEFSSMLYCSAQGISADFL